MFLGACCIGSGLSERILRGRPLVTGVEQAEVVVREADLSRGRGAAGARLTMLVRAGADMFPCALQLVMLVEDATDPRVA